MAVEPNHDRAVVGLDGDDRGEVTVEDTEAGLVLEAQDPVAGLKGSLPCLEGGSLESFRGEMERSGSVG